MWRRKERRCAAQSLFLFLSLSLCGCLGRRTNAIAQTVWHEAADYSANQFNFEAGTILGQESLPKNNFKVLDRKNKQIWSTPIDKTEWQNFAIQLDFSKKYVFRCRVEERSSPIPSRTSFFG